MKYAIEISDLRKEYKKFTLKDVSFNVPQGYIMGLIGPNGAGKTTIIKLIMNLIRRNAGKIEVFEKDNIRYEAEIKEKIGFVYDIPSFYEDVTLKNLASAISPFYSRWNNKLFLKLTDEFDLPLDIKFKKLSHGMKMKFSLILALSHDADLILMDEPTSGLDPVFRLDLLDRLSHLMLNERKTVLFSTHITSDLEKIADYVTFINEGEIVFSSKKEDILENWGIIKANKDFLKQKGVPGIQGYRKGEFGVEILTSDIKKALFDSSLDYVVDKATLEDIMYYKGRGEKNA
jgi:ABC-2 type transport system ATP-binding protein